PARALGRDATAGAAVDLPIVLAQQGHDELGHTALVFDDEHATPLAAEGRHDDDLAGFGRGRDTDREGEREGRSPPFAPGTEPAAVLLDDAVGDGQPEAGAGAHLLGREERLEETRPHLGWDARAV